MTNPTHASICLLLGMLAALGCQPQDEEDTEGENSPGKAGASPQPPVLGNGGAAGFSAIGHSGTGVDLGDLGAVGCAGDAGQSGASGAANSGGASGAASVGGASGNAASGGKGGSGGVAGAPGSAGAAGGAGAAGSGGTIPHGACLDGITTFTTDGPFKSSSRNSGSIKFYVPAVPAGCKVPVVHLANGTGANCATYNASLQRLASHGFLGACYESTNTGAGDQGLKALDTAVSMFPELVDNKFGSTGHSQGGQAAFTVLALAEKKYGDKFIYAGLAIEPASGFGSQPSGTTWQALYAGIKSPMFMFSGLGSDGLVSQAWVKQAYDATSKTQEAYFWTKNGATHIPVPNGETQQISIPWFRWKLLGDQAACRAFKAIPKTDTKWAQVAAKNEQPCQ